jgi:predicted lipoprotein
MYGSFKKIRYYPDNKENTVLAIKAIMDDADISIEDLQ